MEKNPQRAMCAKLKLHMAGKWGINKPCVPSEWHTWQKGNQSINLFRDVRFLESEVLLAVNDLQIEADQHRRYS